MAKVELKAPIVAAITEDVKDAKSLVLVDYRGLTVEQDTQLRRLLLQLQHRLLRKRQTLLHKP